MENLTLRKAIEMAVATEEIRARPSTEPIAALRRRGAVAGVSALM